MKQLITQQQQDMQKGFVKEKESHVMMTVDITYKLGCTRVFHFTMILLNWLILTCNNSRAFCVTTSEKICNFDSKSPISSPHSFQNCRYAWLCSENPLSTRLQIERQRHEIVNILLGIFFHFEMCMSGLLSKREKIH